MTKAELTEAIESGKLETDECPGCPCAGGCEFCPGPCVTHSVDGRALTEDDLDILREVENEILYQIIKA